MRLIATRHRNSTYLVITDNGFGTKANSPDAMLMFHRVTGEDQ